MSRLTDRLDALGRVAPAPMGFAPRPSEKPSPTMLLIGSTPASEAERYSRDDRIDALILTDADALAGENANEPASRSDSIWGACVGDIDFEGLDRLKSRGCDFVVPVSDDQSAAVFRDDDMARGYGVDVGLTEEVARALEFLPVDFLLLTAPESPWPLKISTLIALESTVGLVGSHFVLKVQELPSAQDLEIVRNLPVDALLIDLPSTSNEQISAYRERIDGLPPRRSRSGGGDHHDATVPQTGTLSGTHSHDYDDDDWDDSVRLS